MKREGNKIYVSESEIRTIVKQTIHEMTNIWHEENLRKALNNEPLDEMARINLKETQRNSLFPSNKYRVWIWSNDHTPPHFHVEYPEEGYECSYTISDGSLLEVKGNSDQCHIHNKVMKNVPIWLDQPCAINPKITNRENANMTWEQNHVNL